MQSSHLPRHLIWVGPRATEAGALPRECEVTTVACETGADFALEPAARRREEWDSASLCLPRMGALVEAALDLVPGDVAVVPYTPIGAWNEDTPTIAASRQLADRWSDKAWTRERLRSAGIRTPAAQLVSGEQLEAFGGARPLVVQRKRGSAGKGTFLTSGSSNRERVSGEELLVSEMIEGVPINCAGVVHADGVVAVWPPSVQLLDLLGEGVTFGRYYGNAWIPLPEWIVRVVANAVTRVGELLGADGYRGAFGVDAVANEGDAWVIEVNPRFQGSTALQNRLDWTAGRPSLPSEHVRAVLGLGATAPSAYTYSESAASVCVRAVTQGVAVAEPAAALDTSRGESMIGVVPAYFGVAEGAVVARIVTSQPCFDLRSGCATPYARMIAQSASRMVTGGACS